MKLKFLQLIILHYQSLGHHDFQPCTKVRNVSQIALNSTLTYVRGHRKLMGMVLEVRFRTLMLVIEIHLLMLDIYYF